ncbi:Adagio protein 2 [Phytophthora nicotianae]|uniref:Adagio protein 2 n=1 Tax=Phytophthora nicotianae TaxID=4792 RepID=A0A0W8D7M0_PHYNI|nr:Adagio protein 2 [Phytophthora nicotianae]
MREAIAQKPVAAKYGEAARAWASVAEHVSSAIKDRVLEKQVRDRVRLLKKNWHAGELRSSLGSGIEETLEAVNEQSHYETLAGLVGQYTQLENAAKDDKMDRINKKKADEASATRCASEIVNEALMRRALRQDDIDSDGDSSASDDTNHASSSKSTPSKAHGKRKSAFQLEAERQDKRICDDMELRRLQFDRQMQAQLQQHQDRINLEREMHEHSVQMERTRALVQSQAEERMQRTQHESEERNRQLILECVKLLSGVYRKD